MEPTTYQWEPGAPYVVVLFYKYYPLDSPASLKDYLHERITQFSLLGRVLIATEGVNGTLTGTKDAIDDFVKAVSEDQPIFSRVDWKLSSGAGPQLPLEDVHLKVVNQILSVGSANSIIEQAIQFDNLCFGGLRGTGTHLSPSAFHEGLMNNNNKIILDIRNNFEYEIGHFEGALGLKTTTYAESWKQLDMVLRPDDGEGPAQTQPDVYMYCTGGIRCEKASAYLKAKGYDNVFQLQGGIHKYLEHYPDGGLFKGKNFVFDSRFAMPPPERSASVSAAQSPTDVIAEVEPVIGHCHVCNHAHDSYGYDSVCTVCNALLLTCQSCIRNKPAPKEFHCEKHRNLREIYFKDLSPFTVDQLHRQKERLLSMLTSDLRDKRDKNRRKTIRKQLLRVDEVLSLREQARGGTESNIDEL